MLRSSGDRPEAPRGDATWASGCVAVRYLKEYLAVETTSFWSRVGHWFRRSPAAEFGDRPDRDPVTMDAVSSTGLSTDLQGGPGSGGDGNRLRATRGNASLLRLEEEYARVVNLVENIQRHLATQSEHSEKMARALERLADNLAHVPETAHKQLDALVQISAATGADAASSRRIEENLSHLPQIADAQRETMVSIDRHLDASTQTNSRVVTTLEGVDHSVNKLGESTDASTRAVEKMRWDSAARDELIATLLQEQTRRLTMFAWSAIGVAVVAVIAGVVALLL
jgi:archaellum component FlaC